MGIYYTFACLSRKEFIEMPSIKIREILGNNFCHSILIQFLAMRCVGMSNEFKFLADEYGEQEQIHNKEWRNVTCDVLVNMFEDGFIPDQWQFGWIYNEFQQLGRLDEFSEWIKKFKEKGETK
jgi:hypothetical protein